MTSQIEDELKREILRDNRRGDSGRRGRSGHPGERSDGSQSMSVERGAENDFIGLERFTMERRRLSFAPCHRQQRRSYVDRPQQQRD